MAEYDAFAASCPSRALLDQVVGRWPTLVLVALLEHPCRFADTARRVGGISDRLLSRTLRQLADHGLVQRVDHGSQHVEYSLTAPGRQLATALQGLVQTVYDVMPALGTRSGPR